MTRTERVAETERLIKRGWPRQRIAEYLGVCRKTVNSYLRDPDGSRKRDVNARRGKRCACGRTVSHNAQRCRACYERQAFVSLEEKAETIRLHKEGMSLVEIGLRFGVSDAVIERRLTTWRVIRPKRPSILGEEEVVLTGWAWETAKFVRGRKLVAWLRRWGYADDLETLWPNTGRRLRRWEFEDEQPSYYDVLAVLDKIAPELNPFDLPRRMWLTRRRENGNTGISIKAKAEAIQRGVSLHLEYGYPKAAAAREAGCSEHAIRSRVQKMEQVAA